MSKFKVGDRVAVYSHRRRIGTVVEPPRSHHIEGNLWVDLDGDKYEGVSAHPKQCRKLKKKEKPKPREIWHGLEDNGRLGYVRLDSRAEALKLWPRAVRFREVIE